jgi:hypothetical protein
MYNTYISNWFYLKVSFLHIYRMIFVEDYFCNETYLLFTTNISKTPPFQQRIIIPCFQLQNLIIPLVYSNFSYTMNTYFNSDRELCENTLICFCFIWKKGILILFHIKDSSNCNYPQLWESSSIDIIHSFPLHKGDMKICSNSAKWNLLAIFIYKIIILEHLWSYLY